MERNQLSFDERVILATYRKFYGEEYPAMEEQNKEAHVMAQKMGFLLSLDGIDIGDFGYSWNYHGPYSAGLQSQLRALDQHSALVEEFYKNNADDAGLFTKEDQEGSLFTDKQGQQIAGLAQRLGIEETAENKFQWSELLGSLAFLGHSVYPGADFNEVNEGLKQRKTQYSDTQQNKKAWDLLNKEHLL